MTIAEILKDYSPKVLRNGQIRSMCPFRENHEGKEAFAKGDGNTSFFISPEINAYHCFSCKAKGKITKLLVNKFEIPYFEAVELVNLIPVEREKDKKFELDFIWDLRPPKEFLDRGFSKELLKYFKVGYDEEGRIVIPLYERGVLKGVKYRIEYPERDFWYSEGFVKQEYLYNFNPKWDEVIVVEGETDVWKVFSWDYHVTGLLGVSLSEFQIKELCKVPRVYLALDTDGPGIAAMEKIYHQIKHKTDVMFINYPAKDPGDCSRREFNYAYKHPCSYAEFNLLTG